MRLRRPSPAIVIAMLALFVSLSGTGVAASVVPLAKRALKADNAKKLGGKTEKQITAAAAALPGPTSTIAPVLTARPMPFTLVGNEERAVVMACVPGEKAISGGYQTSAAVISGSSAPTTDGASWSQYLINLSGVQSASGTVTVICAR